MNHDSTLDQLAELPVANIGDAMDRLNIVDAAIASQWRGARLAGRAVTVYTAAGDNAAIHEAIDQLEDGDVLVVNGQGQMHRALVGELMAGRAAVQGCRGFVIDGAVRDVGDCAEMGFPVFARAVTPAGPYRNGPGRVNVDIAVGGVVVHPGDLVLGDDDGIAIVPASEAERILVGATAKHAREMAQRAEIGLDLVH